MNDANDWIAHLLGQRARPDGSDDGCACALETRTSLIGLESVPRPSPKPENDAETDDARWRRASEVIVAFAHLEAAPEAPRGTREPSLRIEEMVARCLVALSGDAMEEATAAARSATRAAYAEQLRWQEYFAYWALCRVRRRTGNVFSAARIAGALARAAPQPWWPLVDWELVLSGGDERTAQRPLTAPASHWRTLCQAALAGDAELAASSRAHLEAFPLVPRFARERDLLCLGFEQVRADEIPWIRSVAGPLHETAERLGRTPAVWEVRPDAEARLRWCVAPLTGEPVGFGAGERVQMAIAALVQVGVRGLEEAALFRRVYGFEYDTATHDGLLRVLLHRLRAEISTHAEVDRVEGRLLLRATHPMVCPEPRTAPTFGDRLLRLVALHPGSTARDLAERVQVGVRSVQRTLRSLGASGACRSFKDGRTLLFEVEDTTFSEPTDFPGVAS